MNSTQIITKESLRHTLQVGNKTQTVVLLYTQYSSMLYGYILKFVPEEDEAGQLLVALFSGLSGQLDDACNSVLSIYCWLQLHAREQIIGHMRISEDTVSFAECMTFLENEPDEVQQAFMEIYLKGRSRKDAAVLMHCTEQEVTESLFIALTVIRRKLS